MKTEKIMQHLIGKTYKEIVTSLSVSQGDGDCCGYADVEIIDAVKELNNSDNAVQAGLNASVASILPLGVYGIRKMGL